LLITDLVELYWREMTLRYVPIRYEDLVDHQETSLRRMPNFVYRADIQERDGARCCSRPCVCVPLAAASVADAGYPGEKLRRASVKLLSRRIARRLAAGADL
jgi:hypothetical protein